MEVDIGKQFESKLTRPDKLQVNANYVRTSLISSKIIITWFEVLEVQETTLGMFQCPL